MTINVGLDSLKTRKKLVINNKVYDYFSLTAASQRCSVDFTRLPAVLCVLLENMLRFEDGGKTVSTDDIGAFAIWIKNNGHNPTEINYRPTRVLMQDFTGVPALVDLAAMRDGIVALGGDPQIINPITPVDLVIDHSVMVDDFGKPESFKVNVEREYERNRERYQFLKWGQTAFDNFRVVPPGTGICHQVNLEYLAKTVWTDKDQNNLMIAYPDSLVGTDSHTTMVNASAVLGWGVGGIEAEAAMLGQPISMLLPDVIGFEFIGSLPEGTTATDLVLKVVEILRTKGVVGKFVEFYGEGLDTLALADRATISNMSPEFGATCAFFPVDDETIRYLTNTGRDKSQVLLVKAYAKVNGLWRGDNYSPMYSDTIEFNLNLIEPAIAGPKRPQDFILLSKAKTAFHNEMQLTFGQQSRLGKKVPVKGKNFTLESGKVVIAAITSCTNTSNPHVMIGAGLIARHAFQRGLTRKPWVKTSLAPGSKVVSAYLEASGLQNDLDKIGFNLVGYGCTTCIGNSGPLLAEISEAITKGNLVVTSILSGNRNFEGRISPDVRANYLASPPLVVAYALSGTMDIDFINEPIGRDIHAKPIFLKDIWPTSKQITAILDKVLDKETFKQKYANVFDGDEKWRSVETKVRETYDWPQASTYVRNPPYFNEISHDMSDISDINDACILIILGDMITTDHISPAGSFTSTTPAGRYLIERGVPDVEFNSYGARRGNHEIMMRGTFANIRIKNEILNNVEGGFTLNVVGKQTSIYESALSFQQQKIPLIIFAGEQYGAGSSRDWAAKGTALLGVKAVIAESFERIHRSNLVGMGVIPFEFYPKDTRKSLNLTGKERVSIVGLSNSIKPLSKVVCHIHYIDGTKVSIDLKCRIDTEIEIKYVRNGSLLHYVLRSLARK